MSVRERSRVRRKIKVSILDSCDRCGKTEEINVDCIRWLCRECGEYNERRVRKKSFYR